MSKTMYTNLLFSGTAGIHPRTLSQDDEPASGTGATQIAESELLMWVDTNDYSNRRYLVYNHGGTVVKIELT